MIKEKESKQERFQETRNPNKKDSDRDQQTFNQLTGGAFKKFVTGN